MKWPTVTIASEQGPASAVAPPIISASRATDIPAFYAPWFFNRLRAGYLLWRNPFNQHAQYVSFARARVVVFWSKNPSPLLSFLPHILAEGRACCLHFTLNDYEAEGWEPHLPPLVERIDTFRRLAQLLGADKLIWRFDPLLLAGSLTQDPNACQYLLDKIAHVGQALAGYTKTLVFSFADIISYRKVQRSMTRHKLEWRDFQPQEMTFMANGIARIAARLGMRACACGEAMDLAAQGIPRSRCLDPGLIVAATNRHPDIMRLFSGSNSALPGLPVQDKFPRDTGQRRHCLCLPSKDVGRYDTCPHGCIYCYATRSRQMALAHLAAHDPQAEGI